MPPPSKVISGTAHPALTGQVARELGVSSTDVEIGPFADGEVRGRIAPLLARPVRESCGVGSEPG